MTDHKPLPPLPSLATLSLEARRHRSRLLRHFLSEAHDAAIEQRLEGWVVVFEDVLDDLGRCIAADESLKGFRKSRRRQGDERRQQAAAAHALHVAATEAKGTVNGTTKHTDESQGQGSTIVPETPLKELPDPVQQPATKGKQLMLCVAPMGPRIPVATEGGDFNAVPANIGCSFTPGTYLIHDTGFPTILYGHMESAASSKEGVGSQVVGGTFTFSGVITPSHHQHLFDVLRISIYLHISLILEQHFFISSNIPLMFPRPSLPSPSPSVPSRPSVERSKTTHRKRTSLIPSGIFSFLSKGSIPRSSTISPILGLHNSLQPPSPARPEQDVPTPRPSLDISIGRLRRISILGERRPSPKRPEAIPEEPVAPFTTTLDQIERSKGSLSTSIGVIFEPPTLLAKIAQAEQQCQSFRLRGDQRTGLGALIGWNGKEHLGKNMSGVPGFLRHQGLSTLAVRRVPSGQSSLPELEVQILTASTSPPSSSTSSGQRTKPTFTVCGQASWKMYRYYSSDEAENLPLGEAILDYISSGEMPCAQIGCHLKRGQHQSCLIHGGVRIITHVGPNGEAKDEEESNQDEERIDIWESCQVCGAESKRVEMSDGTYLMSFGKFLELLVYSPMLATMKPSLCEHTTPPPQPWPNLPFSRFDIIRHFSTKSHTVSFSCSTLEDVFEIRVPRLQITKASGGRSPRESSIARTENTEVDGEKRALRREIKRWWEGVADHIDRLEKVLVSNEETTRLKALPRLPSSDDSYDYDDVTTPRPSTISLPEDIAGLPVPPTTPVKTPWEDPMRSVETFATTPDPRPPIPLKSNPEQTPAERLSSMRQTFHRTEQSLYAQLSRTPVSSLNDARRSFVAAAKGVEKRLRAWQKKHLPPVAASRIPEGLVVEEPEWWGKKCHAVPASNVLIREDDWGSIIAYTLTSSDYQHELSNMSLSRLVSTPPPSSAASEAPSTPSTHSSSSFFSAAMGYRLFAQPGTAQPDPDIDDVAWSEPEAFSSIACRKAHPKDTANIIKEVLRQNSKPFTEAGGTHPGNSSGTANASSASLPLRFGTFTGSSSQRSSGPIPPSAWAKPDVQVTKDEADGKVVVSSSTTSDAAEEVGKILEQEAGKGDSSLMSRPGSTAFGSVASLPWSETRSTGSDLHHRNAQSVSSSSSSSSSSFVSAESDVTIGKGAGEKPSPVVPLLPPPLPPKGEHSLSSLKQVVDAPQPHPRDSTVIAPAPTHPPQSSSFASTLTSGLSSAMRFMLRDPEPSRPTSPYQPSRKHGLLFSTDGAGIDERPHIKHDWTIGKRLKFSCTVYYAKQFEVLRRRCGIDDVFSKSLSRSANWTTDGGKSRSAFWKTADDRFIIKTLVDAWNVADLQVLLEIAPSYFRYMDATANKATVLAKVLGFYTIEIRNLETGAIQSKADLLVMENLFYQQKISKAFDLKGIQGRKVKPATGSKVSQNPAKPKTLFDGEWIEGQQKAMMLVHAHAKHVLRTALRSDSDFLAKSNIMDYSLLVGVNEEQKELVCGLVDTIGSYTFAKTLEYKAKHGLNSGKDITVVPPAEYEERFLNALEGYFVACPDKWSRPPDDSRIIRNITDLPSVL